MLGLATLDEPLRLEAVDEPVRPNSPATRIIRGRISQKSLPMSAHASAAADDGFTTDSMTTMIINSGNG